MGTPASITPSNKIIILFDGVCNLCNGAVQFILSRDRAEKFMFASLQSDFGKSQMIKFGLDPLSLQSILVIDNDRVYQQSDAALIIAKHLGGIWSTVYFFRFAPKAIRDGVYNFIARYRYTFFGRRDSCMIPTPEFKARFIDSNS